MTTDVKFTVCVGAACFVAGALFATRIRGRRSQILADCIDEQIDELEHVWRHLHQGIQDASVNNLLQDKTFKLSIGTQIRLASFEEVASSSLWDTENSQYCGLTGVVKAIDADGDVEVTLDGGGTITTDIKFLAPVEQYVPVMKRASGFDAAMRKLTRAREQRSPRRTTFAAM